MFINDIQLKIIKDSEKFRIESKYPTYPSYHLGYYIEELFFYFFLKNGCVKKRYYIPIFWTTIYNDNINGVQEFLNNLNQNLSYFTICQHDDAVREKLPKDTIVYSAGGNNGDVPIPLVCGKINPKYLTINDNKNKLASFVGSLTHNIRNELYSIYHSDIDFLFKIKKWSPKILDTEFEEFINITKTSKFTLCPRGYGKTSFRLYETLQLGSVPVYVSDEFWLPFSNEVVWEDFCVIINVNQINNIKDILQSIDNEKYNNMVKYGKLVWDKYFEINNMVSHLYNLID